MRLAAALCSLLTSAVYATASTATTQLSLTLGPGNDLQGTASVPFTLYAPIALEIPLGYVTMDPTIFSFSISSGFGFRGCIPIDPTQPYECFLSVNDIATISGPTGEIIQSDFDASLGTYPSNDATGQFIICDRQTLRSQPCILREAPPGSYLLTVQLGESASALYNATVAPFSSTVTATVTYDTPEPVSASLCAVLVCGFFIKPGKRRKAWLVGNA